VRRSNAVPTSFPDPSPPAPPERMLTRRELADRLAISPTQVDRMAEAGAPFVDVGFHAPGRRPAAHRRFSLQAVLSWLAARREVRS